MVLRYCGFLIALIPPAPQPLSNRRVKSAMLGRWRALIYAWAFYLPDVQGELNRFTTQDDRNGARIHVWRYLFRSRRYWWLCLLTTATMIAAMAAPLILWPHLRIAFGRPNAIAERLALFAYSIGLAVFFTVVGMRPMRHMILRRLREHMNEKGITACLACGYDLRGSLSVRCSECGEESAHPIPSANAAK